MKFVYTKQRSGKGQEVKLKGEKAVKLLLKYTKNRLCPGYVLS